MIHTLIALALIFSQLSVLAFGGGNTILPEMQRQVVDVHGWMTAADFSALFALGQAAPGPNLMVVTLVGWHVAGWWGMLVTTIAKFGPSSLITIVALGLWERFKDRPWRGVIQAGIFPMTVGLVASSDGVTTERYWAAPRAFTRYGCCLAARWWVCWRSVSVGACLAQEPP